MAKEHTALSLTLPLRTIVTRGKQWYHFVHSFNIRLRDLVVLLRFLSCDFEINMLLTIACLCEDEVSWKYGHTCGINNFYMGWLHGGTWDSGGGGSGKKSVDVGNGSDNAFFLVYGLFYLSFIMMDRPTFGLTLLTEMR